MTRRIRHYAILTLALLLVACTSESDATRTPDASPTPAPTGIPARSTPTPPPAATREPAPAPTSAPFPAPGAFAATGDLVEPRSGHSVTVLPDGGVLVAGGTRVSPGGLLPSTELFDLDGGLFEAAVEMTVPRTHHSATLLHDGRVLIAGGGRLDGTGVASAEIYDPESEAFTPTGDMQFGRWGKTAALLLDGRVLVAGGGAEGDRHTAELFDPVAGTWSRTGDLNVARFGHNLTALADGRVLISGFGPLELYEPDSGTFRLLDLETPGDLPTATLLLEGRVLLLGGNDLAQFTPGQPNGHGGGPATARAVTFDPRTEELHDAGVISQVRSSHQAVLLEDGRVLVTGGAQDVHHDEPLLTSAELWDPATETFEPTDSMDERRFGHTLTLLSDGSVLTIGTVFDVEEAHAERYLAPPREPRSITGLFSDPRAITQPDRQRSLGPIPASPFDPWNSEDVVVYDAANGTETNLGPGFVAVGGAFSPDRTRFVWTAGPPADPSDIWILDLESGEKRLVTSGVALRWLDHQTIYGRPRMTDQTNERIDVETADWSPAEDVDANPFPLVIEAGRWRLEPPDLEAEAAGPYPS